MSPQLVQGIFIGVFLLLRGGASLQCTDRLVLKVAEMQQVITDLNNIINGQVRKPGQCRFLTFTDYVGMGTDIRVLITF